MSIKSLNSLKKNMAVLLCASFISVLFPEVIHAASQPLSSKPPFLKNSILFIPLFSSANPIFTFIPSNPAMLNILSTVDKKPVENPVKTQEDKKSSDQEDKKDKDSYKDNGNSTSTKPPNGKD